jgi:N-methylhydantoinase B/oxoprolinase/acetone carboxylase alpha subunit
MGDRQAEVDEHAAAVMRLLEADGETEKIQTLIGRLVNESSWRDEVRRIAGRQMDTDQVEELTAESVTEAVMRQAIDALPEAVEATVRRHIRDFLTKKKVPAEAAKPK